MHVCIWHPLEGEANVRPNTNDMNFMSDADA